MPGKTFAAILKFSVLTALFVAVPSLCSAFESIEIVTQERAKALGLEIRSNAAGPDAVLVELEFEIKGELKGYGRVALEMHAEGKLILTSTLKEGTSKSGHVVVSFVADRTKLGELTLKVVEMSGGTRVGHIIPVKEFVDLEKLK